MYEKFLDKSLNSTRQMADAAFIAQYANVVSEKIIRAFVSMRKIINSNNLLFSKIYELEKRQISYEIKTDSKIEIVLNALENKNQKITQTISKQLELDFKKYQKQYKNVELKINKNFHDRFLIIDEKEIYHLGASLKDLGNKVFAFSKFNINSFEFLEKLR
jgi:hypothetical protein